MVTLMVLTLGSYSQLLASQDPRLCPVNWQVFMILVTRFTQQAFNMLLLITNHTPGAVLGT